jgi:hypothetical protein
MAAGKVEYVRTAGGAVRIFEDTLWRTPQAVDSLGYRNAATAAERGTLERA